MWSSHAVYHPRIGFTTMPSGQWRVAAERGGYLVRSNAAGFRSNFEFVPERTPGKFRAILFGDSQTAGDGVPNEKRYSDVVTRLVDQWEVYNYGLSATGPDQQYLTYLDVAKVEHDLVVIGLYVGNIVRVAHRFHVFLTAEGQHVVYAKPYYTLAHGRLMLHHVPVPRALRPLDSVPAEELRHLWRPTPRFARLRKIAKAVGLRTAAYKIAKRRPLPQYDSPDDPHWQLLRAILQSWIAGSQTPVLLFLLPTWEYVEGNCDPTNYQTRFAELARDTGCLLHDPLREFLASSVETRRGYRLPNDPHFSPDGHQALATSLASALRRIISGMDRTKADAVR